MEQKTSETEGPDTQEIAAQGAVDLRIQSFESLRRPEADRIETAGGFCSSSLRRETLNGSPVDVEAVRASEVGSRAGWPRPSRGTAVMEECSFTARRRASASYIKRGSESRSLALEPAPRAARRRSEERARSPRRLLEQVDDIEFLYVFQLVGQPH